MSKNLPHKLLTALILLSIALGMYFYNELPTLVASHWNTVGEVDGYMSKFWGTFLFPLVLLALYLLYIVIPKIDPFKSNIESFQKYYDGFWLVISGFLFYLFCLMLAWNLGRRFNFTAFVVPAVAAMFYGLGVLLEHSKRNWFIGIRTPWTLSNESVWEKTHQLGGKLFKLAAIIALIGLFLPGRSAPILAVIVAAIAISLITVVYSYFEYRKVR